MVKDKNKLNLWIGRHEKLCLVLSEKEKKEQKLQKKKFKKNFDLNIFLYVIIFLC
jgi:hypothetical protein